MALGLLFVGAFGYSLRMETMGCLTIALEDFETDVSRNPANITTLNENYLRLSLGMESADLVISDKWDDIVPNSEYQTTNTDYSYFSMPISVLGFYKMEALVIGLQFDMPKETYTYNWKSDWTRHGQELTNYENQTQNDEIVSSIINMNIVLGYQLGEIGVGVNFGQLKDEFTLTHSYTQLSSGGDTSEEREIGVTTDNAFYGFGATYPTGNMVVEFAYKMSTLTGEGDFKKVVNDGIAEDPTDRDAYPLFLAEITTDLIHLKVKYKYTKNIDISFGMDMTTTDLKADVETASLPKFSPVEGSLKDNNIMFGIGFHEDAFNFGLELNYNMFTVEGTGSDTIGKSMEVSADAKMIVLKAGAEYQATDKLALRVGALKYVPLSGSDEKKEFDPATVELVDAEKYTGDVLNTSNMIITSFGVEYQFNKQMTLEYGYIGGKYLYNQNAMNLVAELAPYGVDTGFRIYNAVTGLGTALFTPMSFTKHVFSVRYNF
ncbi:hypothetical protein KAU33_13075 [Candidatus Dependentiae bacterium]|nr:hypothetical protein [Candidatus Dependentiae bacterium]